MMLLVSIDAKANSVLKHGEWSWNFANQRSRLSIQRKLIPISFEEEDKPQVADFVVLLQGIRLGIKKWK